MLDKVNYGCVRLMGWLGSLLRQEKGQTMVEYGLIVGLVALGSVLAITFLGGRISQALNNIGDAINIAPK